MTETLENVSIKEEAYDIPSLSKDEKHELFNKIDYLLCKAYNKKQKKSVEKEILELLKEIWNKKDTNKLIKHCNNNKFLIKILKEKLIIIENLVKKEESGNLSDSFGIHRAMERARISILIAANPFRFSSKIHKYWPIDELWIKRWIQQEKFRQTEYKNKIQKKRKKNIIEYLRIYIYPWFTAMCVLVIDHKFIS